MRQVILILMFLSLALVASAQRDNSFRYYDSLTFAQYNSAEWKLLASTGVKAISHGHDYYYMRMRIGISYYERAKYLLAIRHFKKAIEYNKGDQIALEYLYYCYYFSNEFLQARALSKYFGPTLKKKTGIETANSNRISIDYLYFDANTEDIIRESTINSPFSEAGTMIIPLSYSNFGVTMNHLYNSGSSITHSLSYLGRKNSLWSSNGISLIPDFEQKVNQIQYSFSPSFAGESGVLFAPVAYYIHSSFNILDFNSMGVGGSNAYQLKVSENNIGGGFKLIANLRSFKPGISAYISRLGQIGYSQFGAELMFFPLANKSFSLGMGYSNKRSNVYESLGVTNIFETKLGFSVRNRFFMDFKGLFGDLTNYIDNNGMVIYNGINKVDRVLKADASFVAGQSGIIIYVGLRTSREYTAFIPEDYIYSTKSLSEFNTYSIIGGLSWSF
ncbi:MAG: hypothetical protein QNK33_11415 [Bacteroidales bacterium]|nr:hypothetical protein [Bacteroidales bacterium]